MHTCGSVSITMELRFVIGLPELRYYFSVCWSTIVISEAWDRVGVFDDWCRIAKVAKLS